MTRYFCDGCGEELTNDNRATGGTIAGDRLGVTVKKGVHKLKVELLISCDNPANSGLFCKYCIIDAFSALDDRPKAAYRVG